MESNFKNHPLNPTAVNLFHEGINRSRKGDLREAILLFRKSIKLEPDWMEPRGHLAYAFLNYGWINQALKTYQYLIQHGHETVEIHLIISDIYRYLRNESKRLFHINKAELMDSVQSKTYQSRIIFKKSIYAIYIEEISWQLIKAFNLLYDKCINTLHNLPGIIKFYQYSCYYIDLLLIIPLDYWRKYVNNFYYKPWLTNDRLLISLPRLIKFLKQYQPNYIQGIYLYSRSIEYIIGLNWIGIQKGQRILDVGAGQSIMLGILIDKQCEVYITDCDSWVLESKNNSLFKNLDIINGKYTIELQDSTLFHYPDNYFDRIVSISSLEHLPGDKDKQSMKEIGRILRSKGYTLITIEAASKYDEQWYSLTSTVGKEYSADYNDKKGKDEHLEFIRFYDDNAIIERIFNPSGLNLIEYGYFADIIPIRAKFNNHRIMNLFGHFQPLLSAIFYRHFTCSQQLITKHAPIGYVILRKS